MDPNTIQQLAAFMQADGRAESLLGKPFMLGEYTCIPVMSVKVGLGKPASFGDETATGDEGESLELKPIGFLVNRGSDIHFITANAPTAMNAILEKIPPLIEKFLEK